MRFVPRPALAAIAALLLLASGCDLLSAEAEVYDSPLSADDRRAPGPSYLQMPVRQQGGAVLHTPSGTRVVRGAYDWWTRDGDLVTAAAGGLLLYGADGQDGRVKDRGLNPDQTGSTGEAISALHYSDRFRIDVFSPDLADRRTIVVPASAFDTDQASGSGAELQLHGDPYTLDGVTWVEWGVNSEDDTLTDHGLFRIEGDQIDGVLRNEPIVRLYPAYDGSALMLLRQDNGEDEDCGGCVVEQDLVELDPETGEVAAEYGMPPGYDRDWRVDAVDKVGDTVAVRFRVYDGEGRDATAQWQLWTYDGEWAEREELAGVRVWFQDGGRLVERPTDPAGSPSTSAGAYPATLTWVPGETGDLSDGEADGEVDGEVLFEPSGATCRLGRGEEFCPQLSTTGSLLPRE
ncbi:hypothetical protein [Nocardioides sambongensis]|uniref:hypothetical protein n=1 Tax=Nocardioides sambongensis TaxID=2589074 RepID=UPI001126BFCA|nr:hypothetical protein [Nocardioides sambongensis]